MRGHVRSDRTRDRRRWSPVRLAATVLGVVLATVGFAGDRGPTAPPLSSTMPPLGDTGEQAGRAPDRIVLTPTSTPATSQRVTWRAAAPVDRAAAQLRELPNGDTRQVQAADHNRVQIGSDPAVPSEFHTALLEDLRPDTRYAYRVGGDGRWSQWRTFRTAAEGLRPWSFIYLADTQQRIARTVADVHGRAAAHLPDARMLVHAGDLVDAAEDDDQWDSWANTEPAIHTRANMIVTPGNHDHADGFPAYWAAQFPYPTNGPTRPADYRDELRASVFTVDYQGVRFVSLNSTRASDEEFVTAQARWLDAVLADNPNRWTVVTQHHPILTTVQAHDQPALREHLMPVLERHGVDLVLQGHNHNYARGHRSNSTTTYVTSVASPVSFPIDDRATWRNADAQRVVEASGQQLYQLIHVGTDELCLESHTATGELNDAFAITRTPDGSKTLRDSCEES